MPRFQEIGYLAAGEALLHPVIGKLVTVESRQSFAGAKPEEALGVLNDAADVIACQAVGGCVGLDWQALGLCTLGQPQKYHAQGKAQGSGKCSAVDHSNSSAFSVQPSAFSLQRSAFSFQRSAFSPQRSAFSFQRSAFSLQRSAFSVQRSAFSPQRSAFSFQRSAFSLQRSAFSVQPSAFSVQP